jgi:hypothetical protein
VLQDGLTRHQLDIALLVAEAEPIAGLPAYPDPFPSSQADAELTSFALRRVESMASTHRLIRQELSERLTLLQVRSCLVCYAMLRCAVLCCAMSCYAVLWYGSH